MSVFWLVLSWVLEMCVCLCRFLTEVHSYSCTNKMSVQNLATVFGPNILRAKAEDPQSIVGGKQDMNTCAICRFYFKGRHSLQVWKEKLMQKCHKPSWFLLATRGWLYYSSHGYDLGDRPEDEFLTSHLFQIFFSTAWSSFLKVMVPYLELNGW